MKQQADQKRQKIKDFDKKQEAKKIKEFDVSNPRSYDVTDLFLAQVEIVKKIESVMANKKSAEYVKTMVNNTVPKQRYLYQRFAEEGAARQIRDSSPKKL